jgi:2-amino-4-hydroxy-6-hydroxymethyldihydropteridine diphosphokinase
VHTDEQLVVAERTSWFPAYIGVGSNLDDPERQVRAAFSALEQLRDTRLMRTSALFRNPPMGPADQPEYVNAAAALLTRLTPEVLLAELLAIETAAGRARQGQEHWGPRILDLDLLVYGSEVVDQDGLQVPHPGISERNFVLFPLLEIAGDLWVPNHGRVAELAALLDDADLHIIS